VSEEVPNTKAVRTKETYVVKRLAQKALGLSFVISFNICHRGSSNYFTTAFVSLRAPLTALLACPKTVYRANVETRILSSLCR